MKFFAFDTRSEWYTQETQLRDAVLRRPLGLNLSKDDVASDAISLHFGICKHEQLIGCVILKPLGDDIYKLRQMAVLPEHQRQGLGKQLVQFAENNLSERKAKQIELNARKEAIQFYLDLGYFTEGETFIEQGIVHQYMRKTLP